MNKQVIELYKQAVEFAYTTAGTDAGKGTIIEGLTAGKFAELIVKECMSIVEGSPWNLPRGYKAVDQAELINQHFGVEQ